MTGRHTPEIVQLARPDDITPAVRRDLIDCWVQVTNAGGAAGFPFPPVTIEQVATATDHIIRDLDPQRSRILIASCEGTLTGWVLIRRDLNPLIAHCGTVHHLQ